MTTRLPPMRISQGTPYAYDVTVQGQNWTGYTGTASFKSKPKAQWFRAADGIVRQEPFLSVTVTADAAGLIQFGLSAAQTDTFPALPRLNFMRQAVCEIAMTNASTGDVQRFQATVSVAARI